MMLAVCKAMGLALMRRGDDCEGGRHNGSVESRRPYVPKEACATQESLLGLVCMESQRKASEWQRGYLLLFEGW